MKSASLLRDWIGLTKPRISLLVLVTALPAFWLGAGAFPGWSLLFWTLLGIALASGSSSVLNNVADRRRDAMMARTKDRPLPARRIHPGAALAVGLLLGLAGVAVLAWAAAPLAAWIAAGAIVFYVGVYTLWLKRTTRHCTVVGGVAGGVGPLIGWAAVQGEVGIPAVALFALLVLWQPGHFWALALLATEDYKRAGFPMLPVVAGVERTMRAILAYGVLFFLGGLAIPLAVEGGLGWVYGPTALVVGGLYLWKTIRFTRSALTRRSALRLFGSSVVTLFLLFGALCVEGWVSGS